MKSADKISHRRKIQIIWILIGSTQVVSHTLKFFSNNILTEKNIFEDNF